MDRVAKELQAMLALPKAAALSHFFQRPLRFSLFTFRPCRKVFRIESCIEERQVAASD